MLYSHDQLYKNSGIWNTNSLVQDLTWVVSYISYNNNRHPHSLSLLSLSLSLSLSLYIYIGRLNIHEIPATVYYFTNTNMVFFLSDLKILYNKNF